MGAAARAGVAMIHAMDASVHAKTNRSQRDLIARGVWIGLGPKGKRRTKSA